MRTQKQIEASRENGRNSRGAATPEGKARVVAANLQSGIFAQTQVLPSERPEDLQALKDEYYAAHPPASPEARCLLDQIICCEWQLRRLTAAENAVWARLSELGSPFCDGAAYAVEQGGQTFARLQSRINSTRRAFHAALKDLERLEARDHDAVVATQPATPEAPVKDVAAIHSPETHLLVLGSLRQTDQPRTDLPRELRHLTCLNQTASL